MNSVISQPLHEFRNGDRWSQVYRTHEGNFLVRMFHKQVWVEDRVIKNHSESYAEDCAENFVLGVMHAEL
jgi:hypothetical protein